MPHYSQNKFMEICSTNLKKKISHFKDLNILEVGSLEMEVEFQSLRDMFQYNNYFGIDLYKGKGVDIVLNGSDLSQLKKKFDVVLSCECFEHAKNWKDIFQSMYDVLNEDGVIIITFASTGRLEHGTLRTNPMESPGTHDDYYHNISKKEFESSFDLKLMFSNHFIFYNKYSFDLYFIGIKNFNVLHNLDNIIQETKKIYEHAPEGQNKLNFKRLIYSHLLSDIRFQNFRFFRRALSKNIKKLISKKL